MTEREWRDAQDLRPSAVLLPLVVLTGAVLRFWELGHGIPYAIGVDEPEIITRVVHMMKTGDLNPHFFHYPGLYFYIELVVACARFLFGAVTGTFRSLAQASASDFYLWGRGMTALLGTATIPLIYWIGMRWGARHALFGAGLLAVMPMHVRESHYVLTDVPMTFFLTLSFLLMIRAHELATPRPFFWAGLALGLAMATKYTAVAGLVLPIVAALMTIHGTSSRGRLFAASLAGCALGFAVGAPYTFLDLPAFLDGFADLSASYPARSASLEPGWLVYFKHLVLNLGWPATIMVLAGLILGFVRVSKGPGRGRWALLVTFPLVYFFFIAGRTLIFGRYLLPVVPFACLLAGIAVVSGVSQLRRFEIPRTPRTILIAGLTIAALIIPVIRSIAFDRMIGRRSTQTLAFRWITAQLPPGSHVVLEKYELRLPDQRYRAEHVLGLTDRTYEEYVAAGVDYLIASSQVFGGPLGAPQSDPQRYKAYQTLFAQTHEVARFEPTPENPGPELRVYQVK